jgi:hypothetical protein
VIEPAAQRLQQKYIAPAENLFQFGAAIAAEPAAGWIGGVETLARLPFQGKEVAVAEGAKTIETIQGLPAMMPRSEEADRQMEPIGKAMQPVGEALMSAEHYLGEGVLEMTDSPLLAAIAHTGPTAALEALGLIGFRKASKAAEMAVRASKQRARRAAQDAADADARRGVEVEEIEEIELEPYGVPRSQRPPEPVYDELGRRIDEGAEVLDELGRPVPGARPPPKSAAERTAEQVSEVLEELDPEERSVYDIVADLKGKFLGAARLRRLGKDVKVNDETVAAADYLNRESGNPISLNVDHYSNSAAWRRVIRSLYMQPDSLLDANEIEALVAIGQRADNMIEEFGGHIDADVFQEALELEYRTIIKELEDGSDAAFAAVSKGKKMPDGSRLPDSGVPPRARAEMDTARDYIAMKLDSYAGAVGRLKGPELALYKMLNEVDEAGNPQLITYEALDSFRQEIGDGFKMKGDFRDAAQADLKQVYRVLIEDQQQIANLYGVGEELALGRKFVERRINMEQRATYLIGKELDKSIVKKLKAAATGLTDGNTKDLARLMKALPESMRRKAAATMLTYLFTKGGKLGDKGLGQGFAGAYAALNRRPQVKATLFKYLEPEAQSRFDAIGKLSSGIYRARQFANTSKTAAPILAALSSMSMVGKITGFVARPIAMAAQAGLGLPVGNIAASAVERGVRRAGVAAKKADALMRSDALATAIQLGAEGNIKAAEILLNRSPAWQAWRKLLGEGTQGQLASMGAIAWLTAPPPTPPPTPQGGGGGEGGWQTEFNEPGLLTRGRGQPEIEGPLTPPTAPPPAPPSAAAPPSRAEAEASRKGNLSAMWGDIQSESESGPRAQALQAEEERLALAAQGIGPQPGLRPPLRPVMTEIGMELASVGEHLTGLPRILLADPIRATGRVMISGSYGDMPSGMDLFEAGSTLFPPMKGVAAGLAVAKAASPARKALQRATRTGPKPKPKRKRKPPKPLTLAEKAVKAEKTAKAIERSTKNARAHKRVKTSGQYVGAPKGVTTPRARRKLATDYADRIEEALDAGIEPGYFYGEGTEVIGRVSQDPAAATKLAKTIAITSQATDVPANVGHAVRGMEQAAMGAPISTGRFPVKMGREIEPVMRGEAIDLGPKRDPFAGAIVGETGPRGVNDMWEMRSMGYPGDAPTDVQHGFMDVIREEARELIKKRRGLDLNPHEAQELNWIVTRSKAEGLELTPEIARAGSIQGALEGRTVQHSFETAPGAATGHFPEYAALPDVEKMAYHRQVIDQLIDPKTGKDKFVEAMGGQLQEPSFAGPGVWKGDVTPGQQSRSVVAGTKSGGIDPSSTQRLSGTEALRAWALAQEVGASTMVIPAKTIKGTDVITVRMGKTLTPSQARRVDDLLLREFGVDKAGDPLVGPIPTPDGVWIRSFGGAEKYAKRMEALEPELQKILGKGSKFERGTALGTYDNLTKAWEQGRSTEAVLAILRGEGAAPALIKHADSPEMRELMGNLGRMYERLGKRATVNKKLVATMNAWAKGGVPAVREMVKKGLAPAAAIGILSQYESPGDLGEKLGRSA